MPPASAPLTSSQERLPPTKEAAAKGQRGEGRRELGWSQSAWRMQRPRGQGGCESRSRHLLCDFGHLNLGLYLFLFGDAVRTQWSDACWSVGTVLVTW